MILTGAFAAVTVMGALYGAGLKTKQEWDEVTKPAILSPTVHFFHPYKC